MALDADHDSSSPLAAAGVPAWSLFALMFALMVVDYVDRQVVVSMFPHLKAQWHLSDRQLGSLVSVIAIVVAVGTVPLSLLADQWSRIRSMFVMAIVWNCATIACAYAASYDELLFARGMIGLGQAAYGSVGAALLAGLFPARIRSTVIGAFLAAGLVGSVLGVVLGGVIAERWGWQAAFVAVGVPGLVLALLFPFVARGSQPRLRDAEGLAKRERMAPRAVVEALRRPRTLWLACLGAGLQLVMVSTTYAWLPTYFNRFYDLPPDRAGLYAGAVVLVSGVGAVLWSMLADRLSGRFDRARLALPAAAALTCAAMMFMAFALLSPGNLQLALIAAGAVAMTGTIGPVVAAVMDVVHPAVRATAASLLALAQNLVGLAGGPFLTGLLSDLYGLQFALAVIPAFCVAAAGVFALATRAYVADVEIARQGETGLLRGLLPAR